MEAIYKFYFDVGHGGIKLIVHTQKAKTGGLPQVWGLPKLLSKYQASQNHVAKSCLQKIFTFIKSMKDYNDR